MTLKCATNSEDTSNVTGKIRTIITLKDKNHEKNQFYANFLVLKHTNDYAIIIGSDVLFSKIHSEITNDMWTFQHNRHNKKYEIPLYQLNINDKNMINIKTTRKTLNKLIPKFSLNNVELKENLLPVEMSSGGAAKSSNEHTPEKNRNILDTKLYNDTFDEFLKNPPKGGNISFTNLEKTEKSFAESLDEIKKEDNDFVLEDNFCENKLPYLTNTILQDDNYITQKYSLEDIKTEHIPQPYRDQLIALCTKYQDIFSKHNFDLGHTQLIKHDIELKQLPKIQKQRYVTEQKEQFTMDAIKRLEHYKVIEDSTDPKMISNLVLVPKFRNARLNTKADKLNSNEDNIKSFRLCQDHRDLNLQTKSIKKPQAINIDQFIGKIKGKIMSQIDLTQAFFAIELTERAKEYTCFYVKNKIKKWNRMSQGLINSSFTYNLLMELTFDDDLLKIILKSEDFQQKLIKTDLQYKDFLQNYVDDLFAYSDTYKDHLLYLELIFIAIRRANLKLSPQKCLFMTKQIDILGYTLNSDDTNLFLEINKAKAILKWETPSSLFELQSRLYSISYFTKFLPKIKEIIFPLIMLLRERHWEWNQIHDDSWKNLKAVLALDIRLTIPHKNERLVLYTDASKISHSQILFVERNNDLHVVSTNSQLFGYLDSRKNIYIKEGLSLIIGIKKFRDYLESTNIQPIVFTDCKSLIYNGRNKDFNISAAQISNYLSKTSQEINFKIFHASGSYNFLADILSRQYHNSRLLGDLTITKEQAEQLPPIRDDFMIDSNQLYDYLTSPLEGEKYDKKTNKRLKVERPTQSMLAMINGRKPEMIALQKITQNTKNDLTKQIDKKEKKKLEKANKSFLHHFEIDDDLLYKYPENCPDDEFQPTADPHHPPDDHPQKHSDTCLDEETEPTADSPSPSNAPQEDTNTTNQLANLITKDDLTQYIIKTNQNIIDNDVTFTENIKHLQENDKFCNKIMQNWTEKTNYPYTKINDILYRKHKKRKLLVLPQILVAPLIMHLHNKFAHPPKTLLYNYVNLYYFGKNLYKEIELRENTCFICLTIKPSIKQTKKSGNKRYLTPLVPRSSWSIDIILSLPKTQTNKTGFLLATCIASRYTTAITINNKSNSEIHDAVMSLINTFGTPRLIISDSDISLINPIKKLQQTFLFGYQTSVPNCQNQNICENSYKCLKTYIMKNIYAENSISRNKWDVSLAIALCNYNKMPLRNMTFTKEEIMFRFPIDNNNLISIEGIDDEDIKNDLKEYIENKVKPIKKKKTDPIQPGQIAYLIKPYLKAQI